VQSPRTDVTGLTQIGYDSSGALTSITNALGQVVQVTQHLPGGLPQTIVDANGVATQYTFDPRSRLLSTTVNTGAGPLTTNFTYDPAGNLTNLALPDASAFSASYDSAHRLTGISDLYQQTVSYSLDTLGDLTRAIISGADGTAQQQHNLTFDSMGRMVQNIGGAGQTNTYTYDANGNYLTVTDPLNSLGNAGMVGVRALPRTPFIGHGGLITEFTPEGLEFFSVTRVPAGKSVLLPTSIGNQIPLGLGRLIAQNRKIDTSKYPQFLSSRLYTGGEWIPDLTGAPAVGYDAKGMVISGDPFRLSELLEDPNIINLKRGACVEVFRGCPGR
jgi:YD repeat-containing protein